jgi:MFS transporter, FSR family, fosmidomycin resistance protein
MILLIPDSSFLIPHDSRLRNGYNLRAGGGDGASALRGGPTVAELEVFERVDGEPTTAPQTSKVATIAAAHAVHDTYSSFLPPLLPVFIERLSLANAEAGLLVVFLQGPSLLQPFIGHLGDRRDLRAVVVATPAVTAVCMCLLGVAPGFGAIAVLLMMAGVSSAVLHALAPVVAGRFSGGRLGFGMGFWMVGGELGRTLGPIVLVSGIAVLGLAGLPWLMVGGLAASALLAMGMRGARPEASSLRKTGGVVEEIRRMRGFFLPLIGIVIARAVMMAAFTTFLPVYLSEEGLSLWLAGASLSVLEGAGVVGALVGGSASDVLGRRKVLVGSLLLTPALMIVFIYTAGWGRVPLLMGLGFAGLMATPVIMAAVLESFPENRSLANGTYMALNFVARAVAVVLVGAMADALGMRQAFLICAGLGVLGTPFVLWLPEGLRPTGDL